MVIFDLDNTLIYTRDAAIRAYELAGMPKDKVQWGTPWLKWCPADVYKAKCDNFEQALRECGYAMPLLDLALRINAMVITATSEKSVEIIKKLFAPKLNVVLMNASINDKVRFLNYFPLGIYIDDDETTRTVVSHQTLWAAIHPDDYAKAIGLQ